MTRDDMLRALAAAARHDGDEEAALAVEEILCEHQVDQGVIAVWRGRAERADRELGLWRAETGAGSPEDAGAAIRHTREDLRQAERERDEWSERFQKSADIVSAAAVAQERAESAVSILTAQLAEERRTVAELRQERDKACKAASIHEEMRRRARMDAEEAEGDAAQVRIRAERAEADNAALRACVTMLRREAPPSGRMATAGEVERWETALSESWGTLRALHPGAALLEDLRVARDLAEIARRIPRPCGHSGDEETGEHDEDCELCLWASLQSAADALKVKP